MDIADFASTLSTHSDLYIEHTDVCEDTGKMSFIITHKTDDRLRHIVLSEAIENHEWVILEAILLGQRVARELRHMSRIVGYFSRIENWNKSKIGELRARQAGTYAIPLLKSVRSYNDYM